LTLSLLVAASARGILLFPHDERGTGHLYIKGALNLVDGYEFSVGTMMHTWIDRSQKEIISVNNTPKISRNSNLMCVRHDLLEITNQAFNAKKIDEVESANLRLYLNHLTLKKGELTFLSIKPGLISRIFTKRRNASMFQF